MSEEQFKILMEEQKKQTDLMTGMFEQLRIMKVRLEEINK